MREDRNDQIYKTKEGKWTAVVNEIAARHENGQPVLVGTISVEVSELLSERLKQREITHTVLNAKPEHAANEAETVAEAGQPGAVTIATNMAGRGVDIKLGGNAEHLVRQQLNREGVDPEEDAETYERLTSEALPAIERSVQENRERVTAAGGLFPVGRIVGGAGHRLGLPGPRVKYVPASAAPHGPATHRNHGYPKPERHHTTKQIRFTVA